MIRVTVELISAVSPSRSKILGVAEIVNDGSLGNGSQGNYNVKFSKREPCLNTTWRSGRVEKFARKRYGAWYLLYKALRSVIETGPDGEKWSSITPDESIDNK